MTDSPKPTDEHTDEHPTTELERLIAQVRAAELAFDMVRDHLIELSALLGPELRPALLALYEARATFEAATALGEPPVNPDQLEIEEP